MVYSNYFNGPKATEADIAQLDMCTCGHVRGQHPGVVASLKADIYPCMWCDCKEFRREGRY